MVTFPLQPPPRRPQHPSRFPRGHGFCRSPPYGPFTLYGRFGRNRGPWSIVLRTSSAAAGMASSHILCFLSVINSSAARRVLSNAQKLEYITAVQCLQRLPGISNLQGAKTRFDDFQALHVTLSEEVHLVVSIPVLRP